MKSFFITFISVLVVGVFGFTAFTNVFAETGGPDVVEIKITEKTYRSALLYWRGSYAGMGEYRYATSPTALAAAEWTNSGVTWSPDNINAVQVEIDGLSGGVTYYFDVRLWVGSGTEKIYGASKSTSYTFDETKACTDTDDGVNDQVYLPGRVIKLGTGQYDDLCLKKSVDNGYETVDSCQGDDCYIAEWYCTNNIIDGKIFPCEYGCTNGACIEPPEETLPVSCVDTDTGKNPDYAGNTRTGNYKTYIIAKDQCIFVTSNGVKGLVDKCDGGSNCFVREQYCNADGETSSYYDAPCLYGCYAGACLPKDESVYVCTDSDQINFKVKGSVKITRDGSIYSSGSDSCFIFKDSAASTVSSCSGSNCFINEVVCSDELNKLEFSSFPCPAGCNDGACNGNIKYESQDNETTYSVSDIQPGWLVKNKDFAEVFYVEADMKLRWVVSEKAAEDNFGPNWDYLVKEIDNLSSAGFEFGLDIKEIYPVSDGGSSTDYKKDSVFPTPEDPVLADVIEDESDIKPGWLVKNKAFAEVFYVDSDMELRWIINEDAALKHFGPTWNQLIKEFEDLSASGLSFGEQLN